MGKLFRMQQGTTIRGINLDNVLQWTATPESETDRASLTIQFVSGPDLQLLDEEVEPVLRWLQGEFTVE